MPTRLVGALALTLCLLPGCAPSRPPGPGSVCDGVPADAGCGSGSPPGGGTSGGRSDAGAADVTVGDAATGSIDGQLLVPRSVPVPTDATGTAPGVGWTVRALDANSTPGVETQTDASGNFALTGVGAAGESFVLEAVPPVGGGTLATLNEFATLPSHYNLFAVPESTLADAAAGAGITLSAGLAHVVIQLVDVASVATGVSVQLVSGVGAAVAYDDGATALTATATATGARGTIALFNIAAPAAGGSLDLRLAKGAASATYRLTVLPGTVNWARVSAP